MCPPVPPPAISSRIVVPGSLRDGLAGDRQEDPDGRETDDERRATRADERQRDPGNRDQGDDDADVDERLQAQPAGDAGCQQRPERVRCRKRGAGPSVGQDEEQHDDRARAEEAELLADDREDEVVERVRHEHPAVAEAGPGQPADAERQQALHGMEAVAEGVGPRVQPRPNAVHLVAAQANEHGRRQPRARQQPEVQQVRPGDEEHREDRQRDDDRRPEVGLLEDQGDDRHHDYQERDRPAPEAPDPCAPLRHPVRQVDDQRELGDLGGVDRRQWPEAQPAR
jgi:hypothetical protein